MLKPYSLHVKRKKRSKDLLFETPLYPINANMNLVSKDYIYIYQA